MCCNNFMFTSLSHGSEDAVMLGDDRKITAKEMSTIKVKLKVRNQRICTQDETEGETPFCFPPSAPS